MERDPIKNEARRYRRKIVVGEGTACAICGERDPAALVAKGRTLLEQDHVFGSANGDLTVTLCRNCHAKRTELQLASGARLSHLDERSFLDRCEAALRSLAAFLQLLVNALGAWADGIAAHVAMLDARYPGWRSHATPRA